MKYLAKCACSKPVITDDRLNAIRIILPIIINCAKALLTITTNKFSHFAVGFSPFLSTILIALRAIWQIDTFENMHSLALLARAYR